MSIENDVKGVWNLVRNSVQTFEAGEALVYEQRVDVDANGVVTADPNGGFVVFFPKQVQAGDCVECVEVVDSSGGGGGPAYDGADAFKSVSGPDANGIITLTRGDLSTETINVNDIRLTGVSYNSTTKELELSLQDEEGNNVSTFNVPLTDLVDAAPDNVVCYKALDPANELTSYTFTSADFQHEGAGGEFKFRTTTVNGVESAEQNIFYYDVNTQEFLPANYPLIVAAIEAHLSAESISYESVEFNVLDNGDGTHKTEVIVLSTNSSINTGTFQVKYNTAFQVTQISAFADGPIDNATFYRKETIGGVDSWFEWDGSQYNALGSAPDFTGLTVTVDDCIVALQVSQDSGNAIQVRNDGLYVPIPRVIGRYKGQLDAGVDTLPTDVNVGDYYYVNAEGDNFGNIEQVDYLNEGDMVQYLDLTGDGDPTNAQNWIGKQRNTDDRFTSLVSIEDDVQTVNLVAAVPLQVNAVNLFFGDIRDVTLRDSNDFDITSGVTIQYFPKPNAGAPPYVELTSNQPLTGVKVYMRGRPS